MSAGRMRSSVFCAGVPELPASLWDACSKMEVLSMICGEGNGNPLQYSCLENPKDGGAWQAIVHGVTKNWTQLSD